MSIRTSANIGFLLGLCFLSMSTLMSYRGINSLIETAERVAHSHLVKEAIEEVTSQMKALETAQRGYLIAGSDDYLVPFNTALNTEDSALDRLEKLIADNPTQQLRVEEFRELKRKKIAEFDQTISLRKIKGLQATLEIALSRTSKEQMARFLSVASEMKMEEDRLLGLSYQKKLEIIQFSKRVIILGSGLAVLLIVVAVFVVGFLERQRLITNQKLENQNWIRSGLVRLSEKLSGDQSIAVLAKTSIEIMTNFIQGQVGALYLADDTGLLKWAGGFGCDENSTQKEFKPGDGMVGQAAIQKAPISISEVPNHYLKVHSAMGASVPRFLHIFPFLHESQVKGVIEIGTFSPPSERHLEFLKACMDIVAVAFYSAQNRYKINELLQGSQAMSEELQTQQEELKAANEELEEQRSELEERTQKLEEINREIQKARREIEEKSFEVERASKHKSEFLANMSHELRTPLNAILLLSRTLAENSENVTEEQKEIYQTIYSSGADLLSLINDILDLSRVEAGKLEVKMTEVKIADLGEAMEGLFREQMKQKGLTFHVNVSNDCPETLLTDRFRLEQILKNFLSNSLKFTEQGKISLSFDRPKSEADLSALDVGRESAIAISVTDTGMGIPREKLAKIFGAFEQVDSTSSRRFGGAGLGLSIAEKLARLLGGQIQVESTLGEGSCFTVLLPEHFGSSSLTCDGLTRDGLTRDRMNTPEGENETHVSRQDNPAANSTPALAVRPVSARNIEDDRGNLTSREKSILVIEDDPVFAKILYGYCHGHGFKCLLAGDGESGLQDTFKFWPSAIILDLRLPGMSGMDVLARLKKDPKTRTIPVHVLSVDERESEVLREGAIGFLSKPVTREGIEAAFHKIEEGLSTLARKVLVVEDKKFERENILSLISNMEKIRAVDVSSAREALDKLSSETFDCMILDLNLPDMTGFDLLAEIDRDPVFSKPPVIIYTSRDLTKDELDRLNTFSSSIIVKGIRSEERLLDELTLFLHWVKKDSPQSRESDLGRADHREGFFKDKKLLIVDDDMRNVFALRSVFFKRGFQIEVAKTGKEALEKLDRQPDTDLVLMDIMMPEMDGFEAMRQIRSQKRFVKLPIIALTAKAMSSDREACLQAGANDYLSKPIDLDRLLSLIQVWLRR